MKHINNEIERLKIQLAEAEELKNRIEALPFTIGDAVVYNGHPALVHGLQHDGASGKLEAAILYVTDEDYSGPMMKKFVNCKVSVDKLAPYTDNAKMLFGKV